MSELGKDPQKPESLFSVFRSGDEGNSSSPLSSLFGSTESAKESAPAQASEALLKAVEERLGKLEEKLERKIAISSQEDQNSSLEKNLEEMRQRAMQAEITLRERQEAQQKAQQDAEAFLKSMAAQRRLEESDRQMRETLSYCRNRIEELESRFSAQTQNPQSDSQMSSSLAELREENKKLAARLEDLSREQAASAREFQSQASAKIAEEKGTLEERFRALAENLEAARHRERSASEEENRKLRSEIDRLLSDQKLAAQEAQKQDQLLSKLAEGLNSERLSQSALAEETKQLRSKIEDLSAAQKAALKEISEQHQDVAQLTEDKSLLKERLRNLEDGLEAERRNAETAQTENQKLHSQIDQLLSAQKLAFEKIEKQGQTLAAFAQSLNVSRRAQIAWDQEKEKLRFRFERQRQAIEELVSSQRAMKESFEERLKTLSTDLTASSDFQVALRQENKNLLSQIETLECSLEKEKREGLARLAELDAKNSTAASLFQKNILALIKGVSSVRLEAIEEEKNRLEALVKSLKTEK